MRRPAARKLYSRLVNVTLPDSLMEFRGGGNQTYKIQYQSIPVAAHVCWPSGTPCLAVNMFLLDKAWGYTGDTAVTVASKLSELIRYCAYGRPDGSPCTFSDLNDQDIFRVVYKLCNDTYVNEPHVRLRNNNTVRAIVMTILDFLVWYQENLLISGRRLIGTREEGAAIVVKRCQNPHSNRYYFEHRSLPPTVSTDPKLPIATSMIETIEATIDSLEFEENYPPAALRRFAGDTSYLRAHLTYLASRRNFMIFLMRISGLRPKEMAFMSLAENGKGIGLSPAHLVLPTCKTRRDDAPLRRFPISKSMAMRVRLYLGARAKWFAYCQRRNPQLSENDSMFLSAEPTNFGLPIGTSALGKDFEMLCNKSGFRDIQSCFSMFRHRFITDRVSIHLKEFESQKGVLNRQDYRTLLEKVRARTGHKSVNSLFHYIDLARDMEGVWDPVESTIERMGEAEQLSFELRDLQKEVEYGSLKSMKTTEVLDHINNRLKKIIRKV